MIAPFPDHCLLVLFSILKEILYSSKYRYFSGGNFSLSLSILYLHDLYILSIPFYVSVNVYLS